MSDVLTKEQWITFEINNEVYVQPIDAIREIVPYREASEVPGAPAEVEGIVNIRGDVISVINGRRLLGINTPHNYDESARIIIIEQQTNLIGFSVDNVSEIVGFNKDQIEYNASDSGLIKGTVNLPQGLFIVADLCEYQNKQDTHE